MKPAYEIVEIEHCTSDEDRIVVCSDMIFKELPPERNPDVLRRALEIATVTHIQVFPETAFRTADDWIEHAREKLESEGRDGASKAHD